MRKKRFKSHRINVKTVSILALSFAIISGCTETTPFSPDSHVVGQEQALKSVKVSKIIKQKIGDPLERTAEVQSSVQFDIITKAAGDIEQILKKRGDMVQEGEVIVKLNSGEAKFQRETASLAVKNAQDALENAKQKSNREMEKQKLELSNSIQKMELGLTDLIRNYNKMKNDYDIGLATKAQLYQMESQMLNARMDLDQQKQKRNTLEPTDLSDLEAQLKNAQISQQQVEQSMTNLEVKAPVSGLLTEMPLEEAMTLQSGAKIGVIQKLDPIIIKGQLTEVETKRMSDKTELTYYLPGTTQKYKGKISYLSKVIDPQTKAYEINLEVPNKEMTLKPGMKVLIQLTDEQDQIVMTIPTYSLVKEGDTDFVYILMGDSVEKRRVQLGRLNEPNQEVLSGVKEGELVVISGPNQLSNKEKVQLAAVEGQ